MGINVWVFLLATSQEELKKKSSVQKFIYAVLVYLKVTYVEVSVKNICVVGEIFLTDNIQTYRVRY